VGIDDESRCVKLGSGDFRRRRDRQVVLSQCL